LPEQDVQSFCCREDEKKMNSKEMNSKEMNNKEMANKEDHNRTRDERAARRSLLREAAEDNSAAESKKPRLDLLDMLSSSTTSVLDILTASGREPLPTFSEDQIIKETETESRPGVLDIFDALPKDDLAEDKEAAVEVVMEVEASKEDSMEETLLEEDFYCKKDEVATIEKILAITTSGAEEVSSDGGLGLHTADESFLGFDADGQAHLAAEDNTRSRKVYLSPALVWLEEEGLPTAETEARAMEKAIGVEMDEEGVMRTALLRWKMMGLEEKAIWRKKVEENANKKL